MNDEFNPDRLRDAKRELWESVSSVKRDRIVICMILAKLREFNPSDPVAVKLHLLSSVHALSETLDLKRALVGSEEQKIEQGEDNFSADDDKILSLLGELDSIQSK